MTIHDFTAKLVSRFDNINQSNLDDIASLIKSISDRDKDLVWEQFIDSYEYNTPPKRATFKKLVYKLGLRESKNTEIYYGYCKKCRTGYPTDIRKCHFCGATLIMTYGNKLPEKYVEMKRYCEMCRRFYPDIQGAVCKLYGNGSHEWGFNADDTKKQLEICKTCQCRRCCYEQRVTNHEHFRYLDMFAEGEFNGTTGFDKK
jgi:hypothetical protein